MNTGSFVWLALAAVCAAGLAATGSKVLEDFSRRELEVYCRRRRRRELFSEILARHDQVAVAAECLQIISAAVAMISIGLWMVARPRETPGPHGGELLLVAVIAIHLLLAATTWIPRAVVRHGSAPFLYHTWRFWDLSSRLLAPLNWGVKFVDGMLRRLAGRHTEEEPDEEEAFEDEIRTIVTAGLREGLLEADAREMIEGVIELGDADVSDIMTPRSHVNALDVDLDWPKVLQFVIDVGRTRIPVYQKTLDNIVGILYAKDLLAELSQPGDRQRNPLRRLLRQAWFVTKTKAVDDLLREFLRTRNHMAIVLDEYSAVAGVVTIEDALEEIVGEIVDESDKEVEEEIQQVDDSTADVVGTTHLDDLNDRLGLGLPEADDFDTIGGLVVSRLGAIPKEGQTLVTGNVRITVLKASRRRVERVRLELLEVPRV